ncbi:hypothetical protein CU097_008772 [Rhizopus azygosporus]|uniref:Uncharacterized protein n=1 Tax=Rhizopus azygosporus TaxID=86630 RepID=A0A367K0V2_RHIAZ|nr:hypothetical protein CU097_008772 [Rhizopus azygosporus]
MKLIEDRKGVKLNFIFANTGKPNGKVLAKDEAKNLYLRKVHIPASEESTSLLAEYLAAILSLKRAVVKNFKTIEYSMSPASVTTQVAQVIFWGRSFAMGRGGIKERILQRINIVVYLSV